MQLNSISLIVKVVFPPLKKRRKMGVYHLPVVFRSIRGVKPKKAKTPLLSRGPSHPANLLSDPPSFLLFFLLYMCFLYSCTVRVTLFISLDACDDKYPGWSLKREKKSMRKKEKGGMKAPIPGRNFIYTYSGPGGRRGRL